MKRMKLWSYKTMSLDELKFELSNLHNGCSNRVNSQGDFVQSKLSGWSN